MDQCSNTDMDYIKTQNALAQEEDIISAGHTVSSGLFIVLKKKKIQL